MKCPVKNLPSYIEFIGENSDFKYRLKNTMLFPLSAAFDNDTFDLLNGDGKVIASLRNGVLKVEKGYKWDGCTFIGNFTETAETVEASIPHDILYIAKKCSPSALKYTLNQADLYFNRLMKTLYGDKSKSVRPTLYYYGIKIFGWPFKFNKVPGYFVKLYD